MNYPIWELPAPGLLIAAVAILHVFISHFAVGGGLFLVVAETKARREGDGALLGFVRALSRGFILLTLVLGALTGVGIWFTIALVQPQATSALVTTFVWAWAIEWTFFAAEIAAAIVYYHGWDRLDPRTHVRVGWIYFACAWASLVVIAGILAFMLTSGDWVSTRRFADGFFNPTYLPMVALRTAVAAGLAGLYVLFAASFLKDADLKARIARWSATRWIAPAAVLVPVALLWYLPVAAGAGVAVAETLGAKSASPGALLVAVFTAVNAGHPIVRGAARVSVLGAGLLVLGSLGLAALRARRYGRLEAGVLMALGLLSMGGGEWVREGLRKPWVIDRYMFVNGVRVGGADRLVADDPFSLEALGRRGVLATSPWAAVPAAYQPGDAGFEGLPVAERAALEAEAGREVFKLECTACHTERAHLGVVRLVRGRSVAAITAVLDATAKPVAADGQPAAWSDPDVRVATWLGRRMPPFAGTEAEKRALAIHLARLGGDDLAGLETPSTAGGGAAVFEQHCAACHGPDSQWPISSRLRGRSAGEIYELIGRLPQVREEMPPFAGTEEERRGLARYLGGLAATEVNP
ncbi:MAG TPA: c-type cytochrome [Vicinamibacteria bacterium]|nr:c-type cytochrome [Vicinamibacteria bacterium]